MQKRNKAREEVGEKWDNREKNGVPLKAKGRRKAEGNSTPPKKQEDAKKTGTERTKKRKTL